MIRSCVCILDEQLSKLKVHVTVQGQITRCRNIRGEESIDRDRDSPYIPKLQKKLSIKSSDSSHFNLKMIVLRQLGMNNKCKNSDLIALQIQNL